MGRGRKGPVEQSQKKPKTFKYPKERLRDKWWRFGKPNEKRTQGLGNFMLEQLALFLLTIKYCRTLEESFVSSRQQTPLVRIISSWQYELDNITHSSVRVWMAGGGGYKCQLSVKILAICQLSVKF